MGVSAVLRYDGQHVSSLYKREKLIISRKQARLSWADSLAFWRNISFFTAADRLKVQSDVWCGQGNTLRSSLMSPSILKSLCHCLGDAMQTWFWVVEGKWINWAPCLAEAIEIMSQMFL